MQYRTFAHFHPTDAADSHRRTREYLDAVHALGAETHGHFAVWPYLSHVNDDDVRFELKEEEFAKHGKLVVGALASPDIE